MLCKYNTYFDNMQGAYSEASISSQLGLGIDIGPSLMRERYSSSKG